MVPSQSKALRQPLRLGVGREELAPLISVNSNRAAGWNHCNPVKVLNCGAQIRSRCASAQGRSPRRHERREDVDGCFGHEGRAAAHAQNGRPM